MTNRKIIGTTYRIDRVPARKINGRLAIYWHVVRRLDGLVVADTAKRRDAVKCLQALEENWQEVKAKKRHHDKIADHIDGYDRDDLSENPDF